MTLKSHIFRDINIILYGICPKMVKINNILTIVKIYLNESLDKIFDK